MVQTEKQAYEALRDPFVFIEKIWKLRPQEIREEYKHLLYKCRKTGDYSIMKLEMFEPCIKGQHITWQQAEIIRAVNYARLGVKAPKISISSGHGIGKSTIMAMIILWFLFVHPMSKIGCTAPTKNQMYDVLWAEIYGWIDKMPEFIKNYYEYTADYVRIKESSENWFARARTARKETPEALAGLHADDMLIMADEASGVPDEIFESAKSALTNENTLFMMISNPTRLEGYFYDSHHRLKDTFQTMKFSSLESPVVSKRFVEEIIAEDGEDSNQYRFRVMGEFPKSESVDEKGYLPLYDYEVVKAKNPEFIGDMIMGVDPAGSGKDKTSIVIRDNWKAWVVAEEKKSTPESVAELVATINMQYPCKYIYYDNFGVGANVGSILANIGIQAIGVNVGESADGKQYANKRAEIYWKSREWCKTGGAVSKGIREEMNAIKYKNNLKNKIVIMGKDEMRRRGIQSPNNADAFALTFCGDIKNGGYRTKMNKKNPLFDGRIREKRGKIYD